MNAIDTQAATLTVPNLLDEAALQMKLRAVARDAPSSGSKRRAWIAFVVVAAIGLLMIAGAFSAMSGLRESAWETTHPTGASPQTVAAPALSPPPATQP